MAESRPRRRRRPRRTSTSVLERINLDAAGIDCGATTHVVAVPTDRDNEPVQSFRTFTTDLQRLADWLVACRKDIEAPRLETVDLAPSPDPSRFLKHPQVTPEAQELAQKSQAWLNVPREAKRE